MLGPYKAQIEALLVENERLPRKQRYTSGKIYRALRQAGYQGAESTVRYYVAQRRKAVRRPAIYLPLTYDPGWMRKWTGARRRSSWRVSK